MLFNKLLNSLTEAALLKKGKKITLVVLPLILIVVVLIYQNDHLPPRTAHRAGRVISHLPIPSSAKVLLFEDEWQGFTGDGHTKIVFGLNKEDFAQLYDQCVKRGYKLLTKSIANKVPYPGYPVTLGKSIYKVVQQNAHHPDIDYIIVVLDEEKQQLIVYNIMI